jgi:predicted dehydrogenase
MSHFSRRRFLQTSAAVTAAGCLNLPSLCGDTRKPSANERLALGVIGVAGQGAYNIDEVVKGGAEIVALCDVDENRAGAARTRFPKATFHVDFRKLIDQKGLDAVLVATPDHMHAIPTVMALRAGLHVYCEKPLAHTVAEVRFVSMTAAKHKRVTQMGTQIHAGGNYRRVVELIQSGAIGPVAEVHAWVPTSWSSGDRPKETPPVPQGLHYDLWLGPAPERPYHPAYIPFHWRRYWDFGGGSLNDMACHYIDLPFWALKLRHPTKVKADGPKPHPEGAPSELTVEYEFPAREEMPAVKLTWYDGGRRPARAKEAGFPDWGAGVLFVGSKGMLLANYSSYKLLPEKEFAGFTSPGKTIPDSIGHHREWIEACKKGTPTTCNFDYSGALAEAVLLGTVSYRSGKVITWDSKKLETGSDEADRYIHKEYRKGWSLT